MRKNEMVTNDFGLEIEIEKEFIENEWFIDEYNIAKMLLYKHRTSLLPLAQEQQEISKIMANLKEGGAR